MTNITYTSHPCVTIEHRSGGPVVVHDRRRTKEEAGRHRSIATFAVLLGVLLMMVVLIGWLQSGQFKWLTIIHLMEAAIIPIAGGVYLLILMRGRVDVSVSGQWLQIRPRPLNFGRGQDVALDQVDHLQIEKGRNYFIQFVDSDGFGLLLPNNALAGISTQDEATAIGNSIAHQFGPGFIPGVQPAAVLSPLLGDVSPRTLLYPDGPAGTDGGMPDTFLPMDTKPGKVDGTIKVNQTNEGAIVSYARSFPALLSLRLFAAVWLTMNTFFILNFSSEWGLGGALIPGLFLIAGIFMLGAGFSRDEMLIEGDLLVHRFRVGPYPMGARRILVDEVERVGTVIAWDSYNSIFYRVVAQAKLGGDFVLVKSLPQDDGHALCLALHKHLGLPI